MTFDMEDTFRAFKHAAQMKKFHFFLWREAYSKYNNSNWSKAKFVTQKRRKIKKERKRFVCAMKIYYNSINSIGIKCNIWLSINELNSIVQEKWIMRYPIDDCVCVCVFAFLSSFVINLFALSLILRKRKTFLISFEASCVCYKLPLTLTGLVLSPPFVVVFFSFAKKKEKTKYTYIYKKKLNQLQREFRISNEFSLFRIASAY